MSIQMKIGRSFVVVATVLGLGVFSVASAQEITPEHEAAARNALNALGMNAQFDAILPNQADLVQIQLTQVNPNYHNQIDQVVTDAAIALAPRRADLEKEAAQIYANIFTTEELDTFTKFFGSEVGQKYFQYAPIAARELGQAGDIWARGIARDLNAKAQEKLNVLIADQAGSPAPTAQ